MLRTSATPPPDSGRAAVLCFLLANCLGVTVAFHLRRDALLDIVFDPGDPGLPVMRSVLTDYAAYGAAMCGLTIFAAVVALDALIRRASLPALRWLPNAVAIICATALGVFVYVDARVFTDYGVHTYDFDVVGVVSNTVFAHDIGIHPSDIALAIGAGFVIAGLQTALLLGLRRRLSRSPASTARRRAGGVALAGLCVIAISGGTAYAATISRVAPEDRAELAEALPFRNVVFLTPRARPYMRVEPRLGRGGYPIIGTDGVKAPTLARKTNLVFFVADGFRADLSAMAPQIQAFGTRPEVIAPQRMYSTGHTTDNGVFGMFYGVNGYDFFPFLESRVNPYPLGVLKANGYVTALIAGSGFAPMPTDHLLRIFDEVLYPTSDDEVARMFREFVAKRRADGRPYLVMAFYYTTHWPFPVKAEHHRFAPSLDDITRTAFQRMEDSAFRSATMNSARNAVLQADDYFQQTFDLVRDDYEHGRTALLVTSDHGTDMWEHGAFGHGRPSFWNGKFLVPFFLGLPGGHIPAGRRTPALGSHVDLWPTLFDYLGADPRPAPEMYSDGLSFLTADSTRLSERGVVLTGRFFPWADRPNALVLGDRKYWFRAAWDGDDTHPLSINVERTTDLADRLVTDESPSDGRTAAGFADLQASFWKFLRATGRSR